MRRQCSVINPSILQLGDEGVKMRKQGAGRREKEGMRGRWDDGTMVRGDEGTRERKRKGEMMGK
jgi:hypothetical protein